MLLGIISDNIKGHCQVSFFWLVKKKILRFILIYKNSFIKKQYFIILFYHFYDYNIIYCPGHRKYSSTYFNEIKVFSLVGQFIWITSYVFPGGNFWASLFKNNIWICIHIYIYTCIHINFTYIQEELEGIPVQRILICWYCPFKIMHAQGLVTDIF